MQTILTIALNDLRIFFFTRAIRSDDRASGGILSAVGVGI